ncbi:MAG: hypothetical protein WBC44_08660 [Planctomycetaceae bacterium]
MQKAALLLIPCLLPSCIPVSGDNAPPKSVSAATAPKIRGMDINAILQFFPGFALVKTETEAADQYVGTLDLNESSVTVDVACYAPDAIASVAVTVHRPGHASGPTLDRLMVEYLPKLLSVPFEGADSQTARTWLTVAMGDMSASGTDDVVIGGVKYSLNKIRSKATLRMTPHIGPVPQQSLPPVIVEQKPPQPSGPPMAAFGGVNLPARPVAPIAPPVSKPVASARAAEPEAVEREQPPPPKYSPKELRDLRDRLETHLASPKPLETLESIASFRRELDAIAKKYPDTETGERAKVESEALGTLYMIRHYRGQVDQTVKLRNLAETYPDTRAAAEVRAAQDVDAVSP